MIAPKEPDKTKLTVDFEWFKVGSEQLIYENQNAEGDKRTVEEIEVVSGELDGMAILRGRAIIGPFHCRIQTPPFKDTPEDEAKAQVQLLFNLFRHVEGRLLKPE